MCMRVHVHVCVHAYLVKERLGLLVGQRGVDGAVQLVRGHVDVVVVAAQGGEGMEVTATRRLEEEEGSDCTLVELACLSPCRYVPPHEVAWPYPPLSPSFPP